MTHSPNHRNPKLLIESSSPVWSGRSGRVNAPVRINFSNGTMPFVAFDPKDTRNLVIALGSARRAAIIQSHHDESGPKARPKRTTQVRWSGRRGTHLGFP